MLAWPLALILALTTVVQAISNGCLSIRRQPGNEPLTFRQKAIFVFLHLAQPFARLWGRAEQGRMPFRCSCNQGWAWPSTRVLERWSEQWVALDERLREVCGALVSKGVAVSRGGDYDGWDLGIRGGAFGGARISMTVEEHGVNRQMEKSRVTPHLRSSSVIALLASLLAASATVGDSAYVPAACFGVRRLARDNDAAGPRRRCRHGAANTYAEGRRPVCSQWNRLGRMLSYARPYGKAWPLILGATALGSVMTMLAPWRMLVLVDQVLSHKPAAPEVSRVLAVLPWTQTPTQLVGWVVAATFAIFLINTLSDVVLTRLWVRVGNGMVYDLARDLHANLQRRSLRYHATTPVGDTLATITGDRWVVHNLIDTVVFAPAVALAMLACIFAVLLKIDLTPALVALAAAPVMAASTLAFKRPTRDVNLRRREADTALQSHVHQTLGAMPVVQAFTQEEREAERFRPVRGRQEHPCEPAAAALRPMVPADRHRRQRRTRDRRPFASPADGDRPAGSPPAGRHNPLQRLLRKG